MGKARMRGIPRTVAEVDAPYIEGLLRRWKHDPSMSVKSFEIEEEPFRFPKFGDKKFIRFRISVDCAAGNAALSLVLRQLPKEDIASITTKDFMHRELQAVKSGLLSDLHCGFYIPYIEAIERPELEQRWIWMDDVTEDVKRLGAVEVLSDQRLRTVLGHAAAFHALNWERKEHLAYPWLLTLRTLTESSFLTLSELLSGAKELSEMTKYKLRMRPWFKDGLMSFWPSVDGTARKYLEQVVNDPGPFFERREALPHTIVHGDFDQRNMGIHEGSDGEMTTVLDWELIGRGHSSEDIGLLLAYNKPENSDELVDYYLGCLEQQLHRQVDRDEWRVGYDLLTIHYFLTRGIIFGLMAKAGLASVPEEMRDQFVARAYSDADKIARVCKRVFAM